VQVGTSSISPITRGTDYAFISEVTLESSPAHILRVSLGWVAPARRTIPADSGGMRDSSLVELGGSYLPLRHLVDGEASLSVHVSGDVRREIRHVTALRARVLLGP
jgi:hypothetical protein